jgi:hypothetical protein
VKIVASHSQYADTCPIAVAYIFLDGEGLTGFKDIDAKNAKKRLMH